MALQIWLPLVKDLKNYGLQQNISFSIVNNSNTIQLSPEGKLGSCYERTAVGTADCVRSSTTLFLDNDFSMCCWALISEAGHTSSANGIITNHNHNAKAGVGITMRYIAEDDYRMSCNTGTGSSRTYHTYAGSTNIYNAWHHLCLTYNKAAQRLRMYVDGKAEIISSYNSQNIATVIGTDLIYNMAATHTFFDLFNWSTEHYTNVSYRPKCKLNDVRVYDHCLSSREIKEISKGLILNYKLNNISINKEYDCSGYQITGTKYGTFESISQVGRYLHGYKFVDGRSTYIRSQTILAPKTMITMSCWVKGRDIGYNNYHIPLCFNSSAYELSITASGKLRGGFVITDENGTATRRCTDTQHPGSLLDDQWHMITITYDGFKIVRYVDGVEARVSNEAEYKFCPGVLSGAQGQWCIGNYSGSGTYGNKNLSMSDIRIYATALSSADVYNLYMTSISITKDGTLFASEFYENNNSNSSFNKAGVVKTETIRDCAADGVTAAQKLQVFNKAIQSTNFIEW